MTSPLRSAASDRIRAYLAKNGPATAAEMIEALCPPEMQETLIRSVMWEMIEQKYLDIDPSTLNLVVLQEPREAIPCEQFTTDMHLHAWELGRVPCVRCGWRYQEHPGNRLEGACRW